VIMDAQTRTRSQNSFLNGARTHARSQSRNSASVSSGRSSLTLSGTRCTRSQAKSDAKSPDNPIDLPLRAIAAGCPPGGVVLDPFSGAGTTGLTALRLGCRFAGIDLVPEFHDEALSRLRPYLPPTGDDETAG
jgi:DNA modification methylase